MRPLHGRKRRAEETRRDNITNCDLDHHRNIVKILFGDRSPPSAPIGHITRSQHTLSPCIPESDAAIEAHEDHAVRYLSSPNPGACYRLESCEHFVEDVHSGTSRRR